MSEAAEAGAEGGESPEQVDASEEGTPGGEGCRSHYCVEFAPDGDETRRDEGTVDGTVEVKKEGLADDGAERAVRSNKRNTVGGGTSSLPVRKLQSSAADGKARRSTISDGVTSATRRDSASRTAKAAVPEEGSAGGALAPFAASPREGGAAARARAALAVEETHSQLSFDSEPEAPTRAVVEEQQEQAQKGQQQQAITSQPVPTARSRKSILKDAVGKVPDRARSANRRTVRMSQAPPTDITFPDEVLDDAGDELAGSHRGSAISHRSGPRSPTAAAAGRSTLARLPSRIVEGQKGDAPSKPEKPAKPPEKVVKASRTFGGEATHETVMSMRELAERLIALRGSLLRSWRLDFDYSGTGEVSKDDFDRACTLLGIHGDDLWQAMTRGRMARLQRTEYSEGQAGVHMTYEDLSREGADDIREVMASVRETGLDMESVWIMIGGGRGVGLSMTPAEFVRGVEDKLHCQGRAANLLAKGLDTCGTGRIWFDEFEYLYWLHKALPHKAIVPRFSILQRGFTGVSPDEISPMLDPAHAAIQREAALEFVRWSIGRWKMVSNIFTEGVSQNCPVHKKMFARSIAGLGFRGDADLVADEIQRVCARQSKSVLAMGALDANHIKEGLISMAQVQAFKKWIGALSRRRLVNTMRVRRGMGSVARSFFLDLDKDGDGQVDRAEFHRMCSAFCCAADFELIWQTMRPNGDPDPLELWDLMPAEAADFEDFGALIMQKAEFDLHRAWDLLDADGSGQVVLDEFRSCVWHMGFQGDADRVFKGLDVSGLGTLYPESFDPVWVLCLKNALPSKQTARRAARIEILCDGRRPVDLQVHLLLERIGMDRPGASSTWDRDLLKRLEKLGYAGMVARMACKLARTLAKKRDLAVGLRQALSKDEEKPAWDDTVLTHRPKPFPAGCCWKRHLQQTEANGVTLTLGDSVADAWGSAPF